MGARFRYLMVRGIVFSGIYGFILYIQGYLAGDEAYYVAKPVRTKDRGLTIEKVLEESGAR